MAANSGHIKSLIQTLKNLLPMKPEDQARLDKKIRLEFNYNSNHIEGNTLTYGETELLLIFDKTTGNHELREYEEMKAHDVVFDLIKQWARDKERTITEADIKSLHKTLLVRPFWKEAITPDGQPTRREIKVGGYKEFPNNVRLPNGEMFLFASVGETPVLIGELMEWLRKEEEKKELSAVHLAALLHYRFVRIHPFDDGNGRLSRLLMNYVLLKHDLPPVIIKSSDKKNYLFALNQADTGNLNAFIEYIEEQMVWSLELSVKAAKGESVDEPGDLDKKLYQLKRNLGEDPNEKLQLTYSDEAIRKVVNETMIPLLKAWETKLKDFDTILMERKMFYSFGNRGFNIFSINDDDSFFSSLSTGVFLPEKPFLAEFRCDVSGLRNINSNIGLNGGSITFILYENAYEITYTGGNKNINLLYHQPIPTEEIGTIAEQLSTFLFNVIEQSIEAHKK